MQNIGIINRGAFKRKKNIYYLLMEVRSKSNAGNLKISNFISRDSPPSPNICGPDRELWTH